MNIVQFTLYNCRIQQYIKAIVRQGKVIVNKLWVTRGYDTLIHDL